jgi:hypothetical protein
MAFKKQKTSNWWKTQGGATELTLTQTGAGSGISCNTRQSNNN